MAHCPIMSCVLLEPELRVNGMYLGNLYLNPARGGSSWIESGCHGHCAALWRASDVLVACLFAVTQIPDKVNPMKAAIVLAHSLSLQERHASGA